MRIDPLRLLYRRVINENSVVFPAPFWPSSTAKVPAGTLSVAPSSALVRPKAWLRPDTSSAGTFVFAAAPAAEVAVSFIAERTSVRSWRHDHAPRGLADGHGLDHLQYRHVDHRDIVADAIGRVE